MPVVALVFCAWCGAPEGAAPAAFVRRWGDYYCSAEHVAQGRWADRGDPPLERLVRLPDRARIAADLEAWERAWAADTVSSWLERLYGARGRAARAAILDDVRLTAALSHDALERSGPDRLAEIFDEARALVEAVIEQYRNEEWVRRDPAMREEPPGGRRLLRLDLLTSPAVAANETVPRLRSYAMRNDGGSDVLHLPGVFHSLEDLEVAMEAAAAARDPS